MNPITKWVICLCLDLVHGDLDPHNIGDDESEGDPGEDDYDDLDPVPELFQISPLELLHLLCYKTREKCTIHPFKRSIYKKNTDLPKTGHEKGILSRLTLDELLLNAWSGVWLGSS